MWIQSNVIAKDFASLLWQTDHGPRGHSCSTVDPDLGQHGLCVPCLDCFPEVSIINILTIFQNFDVSASQQIGSHIDIYVPAESDLASVFMNISHVSSTIGAQPVVRSITEAGFSCNFSLPQELSPPDQFIQEVAELDRNIVKLHKIGHSVGGRGMTVITLSALSINPTERGCPKPEKPGFWNYRGITYTWGTHLSSCVLSATLLTESQWVATVATTYLVHALVADPSEQRPLWHLLGSLMGNLIWIITSIGFPHYSNIESRWICLYLGNKSPLVYLFLIFRHFKRGCDAGTRTARFLDLDWNVLG